MNKPPDFWDNVAQDVSIAAHAMNEQVPLYKDLDDAGKKSMVLICQLAVKAAARRGRFLTTDPVVPNDYKPGAA